MATPGLPASPCDACIACLAPDRRGYSLSDRNLQQQFQAVLGLQVEDGMPSYLCWECAALVVKFHAFRGRCERAYRLLQTVYTHSTYKSINEIDRGKALLTSSYSRSLVFRYSYDPSEIEHKMSDGNNVWSDFKISNIDINLDLVKKEEIEADNANVDHFNHDSNDYVHLHQTKVKKKTQKKTHKSRCNNLENDGIELRETSSKKKSTKRKSSTIRAGTKKLKEHTSIRVKTKKTKERTSIRVKTKKLKERTSVRVKTKKLKERTGAKSKIPAKKSCEGFARVLEVGQREQMEEVRRRQETPAYRQSRHKCALCYKGFMEERAYDNHALKHEPVSGEFQCDVCKIRFRLKRHVRNHIYAVHMTKFLCRSCDHVSTSLEQATNHHKWHAGVTYKCNICGEISNKVTTHLSHVRLKHPSPHICAACGRSFVSDKGLTMHTRLMHKCTIPVALLTPIERDYSVMAAAAAPAERRAEWACGACAVQFDSLAAWRQHMVLTHRDKEEFGNGCRHCGETFESPELYREHFRREHKRRRHAAYGSRTWERPRQCDHCPETVRSALQYYWHIRQSHPGRRYPSGNRFVCEVCGRDFKFNASLTYHRREHSGVLPHACAHCPRAFATRAQRDKHAAAHGDARPHACNICPKAFKEKSALTRHIRYHSGVRPYACDACGKAFTEASSRKLHVRTVHLKLPAPYVSRARLERRRARL